LTPARTTLSVMRELVASAIGVAFRPFVTDAETVPKSM
jgi:hypothetical protein